MKYLNIFYYFNMQARALQSFTKKGSINLKLWQAKISKLRPAFLKNPSSFVLTPLRWIGL